MTAPADISTPRFPEQITKAAGERDGLRYLLLGDDPNWLVVLDHPEADKAIELVRWADDGLYEEDVVTAKDLSYTWARMLTKCPDHKVGDEKSWCQYCIVGVSPEEWWVDWGKKGDNNQGKPGYFPVVVYDIGA